jgi:two-component system sensor histidine kinase/response regulator
LALLGVLTLVRDGAAITRVLDATAPSADAAPPVLDAEIIGRLGQLGDATGEDLLGQLTVLFLADADTKIIDLRDAIIADDAAAVVRSAHSLSGASANLGATHLAGLCASLELNGASGDLTGGSRLLDALEHELGRVHLALHELVGTA